MEISYVEHMVQCNNTLRMRNCARSRHVFHAEIHRTGMVESSEVGGTTVERRSIDHNNQENRRRAKTRKWSNWIRDYYTLRCCWWLQLLTVAVALSFYGATVSIARLRLLSPYVCRLQDSIPSEFFRSLLSLLAHNNANTDMSIHYLGMCLGTLNIFFI